MGLGFKDMGISGEKRYVKGVKLRAYGRSVCLEHTSRGERS